MPLIALEGIDGSGKTTQARLLADALRARQRRVVLTQEPTNGPIGSMIRAALRGEIKLPEESMPHLFAADRAAHAIDIRRDLMDGVVVICDRYIVSSVVYQGYSLSPLPADAGEAEAAILWLNRHFPQPDITVMIRVRPQVAAARLVERGTPERYDGMLDALAARYDQACAGDHGLASLVVVDGEQSELEVAQDVMRGIERYWPGRWYAS
jgi:dTMP kinase